MLFRNPAALFALVGLAAAAPSRQEPRVPRMLTHDDVLLPRADGRYDVMKDWEWSDIERRIEKEIRELAEEEKRRALAGEIVSEGASLGVDTGSLRRRCDSITEIQVLTDTQFTNWDVAMSPVVGATGGQASINVVRGHSVTNMVTVGAQVDYSYFEKVFKTSLRIEYGRSWTTQDSLSLNYFIDPGQFGVVVSNPWTRRLTGNYVTGCPDEPKYEPFISDSYDSQDFSGMTWVAGPIRLCNSSSLPIPFCIGTGVHDMPKDGEQ